MNASSLLPRAKAVASSVPTTPEQLAAQRARQRAIAEALAKNKLLSSIDELRAIFTTKVAAIQNHLKKNPQGLTEDEVLALLTPEQRAALASLSDWAAQGIAAFTPPTVAAGDVVVAEEASTSAEGT